MGRPHCPGPARVEIIRSRLPGVMPDTLSGKSVRTGLAHVAIACSTRPTAWKRN